MRTRSLGLVVTLAILLGSLLALAGCPETGGTTDITVTFKALCSYDDSVLPDATVEVDDQSCTSDANGECDIDLATGTYDVNVSHDSHPSNTMEITVEAGTSTIEVTCGCSV